MSRPVTRIAAGPAAEKVGARKPVTIKAAGSKLAVAEAPAAPAGDDLPDLVTMMSNAREASNFLKAVAHANRLMLLCILARREHSVTELEELLSERQTTVSQQLARLRLDDLVTTRRVGKTVYYRLADDDLIKFIRLIHEMFHKPAGQVGK